MRGLGVDQGDVVVGYLPNVVGTVVAFLAVVSLGAIWAAVGQDYAARAAADRFAQLEPVLLVAADGHAFNGRERDRREAVAELLAELPTVRNVIGVSRLGTAITGALPWAEVTAEPAPFAPVDTAFADPIWVLFFSGTTGLHKGIVHCHGGVLVPIERLIQGAEFARVVDPSVVDDMTLMEDFRVIAEERVRARARS